MRKLFKKPFHVPKPSGIVRRPRKKNEDQFFLTNSGNLYLEEVSLTQQKIIMKLPIRLKPGNTHSKNLGRKKTCPPKIKKSSTILGPGFT